MAKKRKGAGRGADDKQSGSLDIDPKQSKLRISTFEDVAGSDDEFHLGQEKVLLEEGPDAKRRRKQAEQDAFLEHSDDEIMAYDSEPSSDEGLDDEDDDEDEDDDMEGYNGLSGNLVSKSRLREDLRDAADESGEEDEDAELSKWGSKSTNYYGADAIETEQDAIDEYTEAIRLQKKQTQNFGISGFGFDEAEWKAAGGDEEKKEETTETVVVKEVSDLAVPDTMAAEDRLELLKSRFPEFEDLSNELHTLHQERQNLQEELSTLKGADPSLVALLHTKMRALSTYLSTLAMYFVILTSPASSALPPGSQQPLAKAPGEMHDHPIMNELVRCRQLWNMMENLRVPTSDDESEEDEEEDTLAVENLSEESLSEEESSSAHIRSTKTKEKVRKSKSQRKAEKAAREAAAAKAEKVQNTLSTLDNLIAAASESQKRKVASNAVSTSTTKPSKSLSTQGAKSLYTTRNDGDDDDSDLGEPEQLTEGEIRDKMQKRRSVRFHMSQIAQRDLKESRGAVNGGGDEDIPYRERWRDRLERLNKEAEARGRKQPQGKEVLGSRDSDSEDDGESRGKDQKSLIPAAADDDDDYYDMIASRRSSKLAQKAEAAAAAAEAKAVKGVVVPVEEIGPDGKRKITYQIEKNKGLTVNRRKAIKNPRVKKRMKYEEKMKKLKSMKAVYGGGEAKGGYGGEKTGIKAGLIRSRKL